MKANGLRRLTSLSLAVLCFALASLAIAQPPKNTEPDTNPNANPTRPDASTAVTGKTPVAVDPKTYKVGAEDVLAIRVWREPDLSGPKVVRPDGKISIPMIGEVQAQGLTPEQIQDAIATKLGEYIKEPQVSVELQDVRSKKYFLLGAIDRPGEYRFALPINVLEALSNGGRFHDFARTSRIVVLRGDKKFTFNYKEVTKGKKMDQNIQIEDGDKIIVPE